MTDFGSLRALALDANFSVHGLPATVTLPSGEVITTRVIWPVPQTEPMPSGAGLSRMEPIRVVALRKDEVPSVPLQTRIVAPEKGGDDDATWVVDGYERFEADHHRVIVVPES